MGARCTREPACGRRKGRAVAEMTSIGVCCWVAPGQRVVDLLAEPSAQQILALLCAFSAFFLGAAEELGKLGVAFALGVMDVVFNRSVLDRHASVNQMML
jgi:hypothetical protein